VKQRTVNVLYFYAGSSDVSKADVVSPKQKSALGIVGIYLKKISDYEMFSTAGN